MIKERAKPNPNHAPKLQTLTDMIEYVWPETAMKTVEALVLIADDVPDSDGYLYHLTGRTIQGKVPITCEASSGEGYDSFVKSGKGIYANCVGYASLELRDDKLYASLKILAGRGKIDPQPVFLSISRR